jgi:hypothetical protein
LNRTVTEPLGTKSVGTTAKRSGSSVRRHLNATVPSWHATVEGVCVSAHRARPSNATHDTTNATHDIMSATHDIMNATHDIMNATHDIMTGGVRARDDWQR